MYPTRTCAACSGEAKVVRTTRKFGIETNAHYQCEGCQRFFTVMTPTGKSVSVVIGIPLLLILVLAPVLNPSKKPQENVAMVVLMLVLFAILGYGGFQQLRNEKANPPRSSR